MALRAVKSVPVPPIAPEVRAAAFLVVDAKGAVTSIEGWETLALDEPPASLLPGSPLDSPLPRALAALVETARRTNRPESAMVEVTTDKARFYAAIAAPMSGPGRPARLAVSVAETDAPGASDAEGRIIRQLGHDLRTPLTSISGGVELMQSGRLGGLQPQQERILGLMQKGVEAMVRLIDESTAPYRRHKDLLAALGGHGGDLTGDGEDDPGGGQNRGGTDR
jgi:signal transduction histidine kinase